MTIKTGIIVSHSGVEEWGAGRVLQVTPTMAEIHFSDGNTRKIASTHFPLLQPADAGSYRPEAVPAPAAKPARQTAKSRKK